MSTCPNGACSTCEPVARRPTATTASLGVQEAFVDYHLRNVSDRYDFDSIRVGIQPFNFDFRGFLFQDNQLGIRLFGNRDNNRLQYNLAAFWRLEKDTNSRPQRPDPDAARRLRLHRQPVSARTSRSSGLTSQVTSTYNINREARRDPGRQQRLPGAPGAARRPARRATTTSSISATAATGISGGST